VASTSSSTGNRFPKGWEHPAFGSQCGKEDDFSSLLWNEVILISVEVVDKNVLISDIQLEKKFYAHSSKGDKAALYENAGRLLGRA
jgi:hypothetical protein